jgi:serine/threonine protein kinase
VIGRSGKVVRQTYLVRDLEGDAEARYALKRLKNVNRVDRFEREIQAVMSLDHPNVLKPVDFSLGTSARDKPYLVTEYCAGGSIASGDVSRWASDPVATLELFTLVCDGVAAAHNHRPEPIVHRDLKPENILLRTEKGPPVVADFGIAYLDQGERERLTAVDEAVGARLFIAPELADGRADQVRPWSDVYSLGKLLYWMLKGGRVFDREQHRSHAWDLVKKNRWNGYEHVNRMLDRMIAHDPAARYRDAGRASQAAVVVTDLLRRGARPIGPDIEQVCDFCKQGVYRDAGIKEPFDFQNWMGSLQSSEAIWRILVCDQCGHVQWFRLEKAEGQNTLWGVRADRRP